MEPTSTIGNEVGYDTKDTLKYDSTTTSNWGHESLNKCHTPETIRECGFFLRHIYFTYAC